MSIGENIKNRRMKKGYTQEQMAVAIGVGRSMIAQIERGTRIPNLVLGKEIAKTLGCTIDQLTEGIG